MRRRTIDIDDSSTTLHVIVLHFVVSQSTYTIETKTVRTKRTYVSVSVSATIANRCWPNAKDSTVFLMYVVKLFFFCAYQLIDLQFF